MSAATRGYPGSIHRTIARQLAGVPLIFSKADRCRIIAMHHARPRFWFDRNRRRDLIPNLRKFLRRDRMFFRRVVARRWGLES